MSLLVTGEFDGNEVVCDSKQKKKCALDSNSSFTVEIVPNKVPQAGYAFWQTLLDYGDLWYKQRPVEEEVTWDLSFLPLQAPDPVGPFGRIGHGDLSASSPPFPRSVQTTTLVTLDFNCSTSETLRMVDFDESRDGSAFGGKDDTDLFVPEVGALDIVCTQTPTPPFTPVQPTDTPPAPTATPSAPCGDIDKSGAVDSLDALLALQIDGGLVVMPAVLPPHWDVNGDSAINALDAALILQFEAGLLATLTC